jgi:hypothetical protein
MAFTPIPAAPNDLLIAATNSAIGVTPPWTKLRDHQVLAWMCDIGAAPVPIIVGVTPTAAVSATGKPALAGVPYVVRHGHAYTTPDGLSRGTALEVFNQLAAGGTQLYGDFFDNALAEEFRVWGAANPTLYLTEDPEVTAARMKAIAAAEAAAAQAAAQAAKEAEEAIEAQARANAAQAAAQAAHKGQTRAHKEA